MTLAQDDYLNQLRSSYNDAASEELYLEGLSDGYEGKPYASDDYIYHLGHAAGIGKYIEENAEKGRQKIQEIRETLEILHW